MTTAVDTHATTTLASPLTLPSGAEMQLGGPADEPTSELARVYRRGAQGGGGLIITGNGV